MNRIEYELLRAERPEFRLPPWEQMEHTGRSWVDTYTRERAEVELTLFCLEHGAHYFRFDPGL